MDAFEAWLEYLFDRPPSDFAPLPAWYHRVEDRPTEWTVSYEQDDSPAAQAERISRLFSDAGQLLRPYSDEQVGHGLNFIINPACGGDIWVLAADEVPSALRAAGVRSIVTLFAEVIAPRMRKAEPYPWLQRSEPRQHMPILGFVCYMFWDVINFVPGPEDMDTTLEVLEATLALDSVACQGAALHGLGHTHYKARDKVPEIIQRWLERHPDTPDELRAYALQASRGRVL